MNRNDFDIEWLERPTGTYCRAQLKWGMEWWLDPMTLVQASDPEKVRALIEDRVCLELHNRLYGETIKQLRSIAVDVRNANRYAATYPITGDLLSSIELRVIEAAEGIALADEVTLQQGDNDA